VTRRRRSLRAPVPVLFISHLARDDAAAASLDAWLRGTGFTDVFVQHPSTGRGAPAAQG